MTRPIIVTEEQVEQALVDSYVSLPITDTAQAAELVNCVLALLFGEVDD